MCIEKHFHSFLFPLNCQVPRRLAILKKSVTAKNGEERKMNQVTEKEKHSTIFKDDEGKEEREHKRKYKLDNKIYLSNKKTKNKKREMARERRLAVHDNNMILLK